MLLYHFFLNSGYLSNKEEIIFSWICRTFVSVTVFMAALDSSL